MHNIERKRLIGLELLRIIAMLFVFTYHFVCTGKFVESSNCSIFVQANVVKFLVIVAVNCYVLITAYFMSEKNFKLSRITNTYKIAWFYSVLCFFLISIIFKGSFSISGMIKSFLPFTFNEYWFVNKYILLLLVSPILNRAFVNASKATMKLYLFVVVGIFCIYNTVVFFFSPIDSGRGFSLSWFLVLYVVGAYLKKYYSPTMKPMKYLLLYFLFSFLNVSLFFFSKWVGLNWLSALVANYNSVFIFFQSVFLFLTFLNLDITSIKIRKIILTVAPLTFAVYLIHESTGFKNYIWLFVNDSSFYLPEVLFIPSLIIFIFVAFFICVLVECIRVKIFDILKIDTFITNLSSKVEYAVRKLANR